MTNKLRFASVGLAIMMAGASLVPAAKADEWDKRTIVTFSGPVQVPGKVLEAGTYVFNLADSQSDRDIVQVFTGDGMQLITTILAIPDYSVVTPDKTVINFEERRSGTPEAVKSWFYPGENYGFEFVYPKEAMQVAANSEPSAPMTATSEKTMTMPTPPEMEPDAQDNPQPEPALTAQDVEPAQDEEPAVVAQETPVQTEQAPESMPQSLPETAGNFALLPLTGAGLLVGGASLARLARQRS